MIGLLVAALAQADRIRSGLGNGESLKARVPLAPEAILAAKTLALDVQNAYPTQFRSPLSNLLRNVQDRGVPVIRGGAAVVDGVTGQPILQVRRVQVKHWIGRGALSVRAERGDTVTGAMLGNN